MNVKAIGWYSRGETFPHPVNPLHVDAFLGRKPRTVPGNHLTGIQQWFKWLSIDFCKSLPYFMTSLFSIEIKIFPLIKGKKKSLTSSRVGFVIKDSEQGTNSTALRGLLGIKRRYVSNVYTASGVQRTLKAQVCAPEFRRYSKAAYNVYASETSPTLNTSHALSHVTDSF